MFDTDMRYLILTSS